MSDLISRTEAIKRLRDAENGVFIGFYGGLEMAYKIVANMPSAQQWIPCSERLPEDDRSKVVTLANGNTECGYYSNGDWWCIGDSISLENPTVIAWMPLPPPPEVEE